MEDEYNSFSCHSCSAPLSGEGLLRVKCRYCGALLVKQNVTVEPEGTRNSKLTQNVVYRKSPDVQIKEWEKRDEREGMRVEKEKNYWSSRALGYLIGISGLLIFAIFSRCTDFFEHVLSDPPDRKQTRRKNEKKIKENNLSKVHPSQLTPTPETSFLSNFDGLETGTLPDPWIGWTNKSDPSVNSTGHFQISTSSSRSKPKSLECLETSNNTRWCFLPIRPGSKTTLSVHYLKRATGPESEAALELYDKNWVKIKTLIPTNSTQNGTNKTTGWKHLNKINLSRYSGKMIYFSLKATGPSSPARNGRAVIRIDNLSIR